MRTILTFILFSLFSLNVGAQDQKPNDNKATIYRPKLVVGIVVDQMRWDYLYRYTGRYQSTGGFKRMLAQGFSCENTFIPYIPTVTACGHTCIYTGSVPAIHGITGNSWWDNNLMRSVYCSEDREVKTVGADGTAGEMSPRNMLTTTICDELRLGTNFNSKVIGIAIKDRGAILAAGHSANAAYWYDGKSGNWISSTYYMNDLPQWVKDFNGRKLTNKYYQQGWNTLYPLNAYLQSTEDQKDYEIKVFGADAKGFPYDLKKFIDKNFGTIAVTPFGNTFTLEMAKSALINEQLGMDETTDFLAISLSSTDYVGHSFGPNSIEAADTYLRLDKDLGDFLNFLDSKVGKGQYLLFLSADHGVAHVPAFLKEHKIPAGAIDEERLNRELTLLMKNKFGTDKVVATSKNYQVYLNHLIIDSLKLDEASIRKTIINFLETKEGISRVIDLHDLSKEPLNKVQEDMVANGYFPRRSGDIQLIFDPQWIDGSYTGTTHGSWNPYDAHIPLLWYGWNVKSGKTNRQVYMTDIAATIAAMLKIQMPSGCVGTVIEELMK
jgi:predicted AlkP superfamily pyrophosphatase or phosphodiesterase